MKNRIEKQTVTPEITDVTVYLYIRGIVYIGSNTR